MAPISHTPVRNTPNRTLQRDASKPHTTIKQSFNTPTNGDAHDKLLAQLNNGTLPEWVIRMNNEPSAPENRDEHMAHIEKIREFTRDGEEFRYENFTIHPHSYNIPNAVQTAYFDAKPPEDAYDPETIVIQDKCRLVIEMDDDGTVTTAYLKITFYPATLVEADAE